MTDTSTRADELRERLDRHTRAMERRYPSGHPDLLDPAVSADLGAELIALEAERTGFSLSRSIEADDLRFANPENEWITRGSVDLWGKS